MTQNAEQHTEERSLREVRANPPPSMKDRRETPMFQTMTELRVRHGDLPIGRDRLYLWGGGLLIGSVLFGLLYLMIHFLE